MSQASDHQPNHRQIDPGFTALRPSFIILDTQPPTAREPGKRALDDPTAGLYDKAFLTLWAQHPLQDEGKPCSGPHQQGSAIAAIDSDAPQFLAGAPRRASTRRAPAFSDTEAAVTTTTSNTPSVSTSDSL